MKGRMTAILVTIALCLPAILTGPVEAQATQRELATHILSGSVSERHRAVQRVIEMGPQNAGPELRAALISALAQEARLSREHDAIEERGGTPERNPDPEFAWRLTDAVVALEDPAAIPVLAASLGTGSTAGMWALVDFGERAAPAVLEIARSRGSSAIPAYWALIALRAMVEEQSARPLSPQTLEEIRRVAGDRLQEKQEDAALPLRRAIDLALVTGDPHLRAQVERLATDPAQLISRDITDPDLIQRIQALAKDRLAGVPPRPRRQ